MRNSNKKLSLIPILLFLTLPCLSLFVSTSSAQVVALSVDQTYVIDQVVGSVQNKPSSPPGKPPKNGGIQYELFIEIDYMEGHEPTGAVLLYIQDYYSARGISVTFYVDELVEDPTTDTKITDEDFELLEESYDDHDFGYYSEWKWVLFGTAVEDQPNVAGYAQVILGLSYNPLTGQIKNVDCLAGNYIFIADETSDQWADSKSEQGVTQTEAEAVVLMHEMGHSIGIMKAGWSGNVTSYTIWEIYDSDTTSVMSYLNPDNCNAVDRKGNPNWHYSSSYWKLRNMEYYAIG